MKQKEKQLSSGTEMKSVLYTGVCLPHAFNKKKRRWCTHTQATFNGPPNVVVLTQDSAAGQND